MDEQDELDFLIEQLALAGNNYGSGPGYLGAKANPYKRADERLNFASDINRYTGLYLDDMLGIPKAPEAPEPFDVLPPQAPTGAFQSDIRNAYGNNPIIARAFADIESGVADPITVANQLAAAAQQDPEIAASLPQFSSSGAFGTETGVATGELADLFSRFATEVQREKREGGAQSAEYDQALQQYMMQRELHNQQADEYDRYFQPPSALDDAGYQGVEDYVQQNATRLPETMVSPRVGTSAPAPASFNVPRPTISPVAQGLMNKGFTFAPGVAEASGPRISPIAQGLMDKGFTFAPGVAEKSGRKGQERGGRKRPHPQPPKGTPAPTPKGSVQHRNTTNERVNKWADEFNTKAAERRQASTRPSQAEEDNKKRLKAAYSLIFGEAPPR